MAKNKPKLFALYAMAFGCNNIISTFIPIFLQEKGFDRWQIGLILSASFMVSIVAMPFWGKRADRAANMNHVLMFTQGMAGLFLTLFIVLRHKIIGVICYILFSCFHCAGVFLADAIILGLSRKHHDNYGHIRIGGTLGYAGIGALSSVVALWNFHGAILLYVAVVGAELLLLWRMDACKKMQVKTKQKGSLSSVLKDKRIVILLGFSFIIFVLLDFYSAFYGLYLREKGAGPFLVGVAFSIAALSEIPFLMGARFLENKFSLPLLLVGAILVVAVRFFGYYLANALWAAIAWQLLQGIGNSVIIYSVVRLMYTWVSPENKATGQSLAALTGQMGLPGVFSALLGGHFSQKFPLPLCFLTGSILLFVLWIAYLCWGLPILKGGFHERDTARAKRRPTKH